MPTGPATGASRRSAARGGAIDGASFVLPALVLLFFVLGSVGFSSLASTLLRASLDSRLALNVSVCAGWPTWVACAARAGVGGFGAGFQLVLRLV